MGYDKWLIELKRLATEKDLLWLVGDDDDYLKECHDCDDNPKTALDEMISNAQG